LQEAVQTHINADYPVDAMAQINSYVRPNARLM